MQKYYSSRDLILHVSVLNILRCRSLFSKSTSFRLQAQCARTCRQCLAIMVTMFSRTKSAITAFEFSRRVCWRHPHPRNCRLRWERSCQYFSRRSFASAPLHNKVCMALRPDTSVYLKCSTGPFESTVRRNPTRKGMFTRSALDFDRRIWKSMDRVT